MIEYNILQVFENKVFRKMFNLEKYEVSIQFEILQKEKIVVCGCHLVLLEQ